MLQVYNTANCVNTVVRWLRHPLMVEERDSNIVFEATAYTQTFPARWVGSWKEISYLNLIPAYKFPLQGDTLLVILKINVKMESDWSLSSCIEQKLNNGLIYIVDNRAKSHMAFFLSLPPLTLGDMEGWNWTSCKWNKTSIIVNLGDYLDNLGILW